MLSPIQRCGKKPVCVLSTTFFFFFWRKKPYMSAKLANLSSISRQLKETSGIGCVDSTTHDGGSCFATASDEYVT